jgi:hypothetical protein
VLADAVSVEERCIHLVAETQETLIARRIAIGFEILPRLVEMASHQGFSGNSAEGVGLIYESPQDTCPALRGFIEKDGAMVSIADPLRGQFRFLHLEELFAPTKNRILKGGLQGRIGIKLG